MSVHLTEAQARKLGFTPAKSKSKKKGMARAGAKTRCCTCGEVFTSDAAETRHVEEARHFRYEGVDE